MTTTTTRPKTLRYMAAEVFEVNDANGWFEDDRTVGDDLALLHSEVSEALEAYRSHGLDDVTEASCKTKDLLGHIFANEHMCKPEGVGSELADVLIRLLDTVTRRAIAAEWLDTPLTHVSFPLIPAASSFGDDIAGLHKLIADAHLERVLVAVLAAAHKYDVDIYAEYERKLAFNRTRGHRHGGKRL